MLFYFIQTWTEWKSDVKRKLAQNKAESRATGGGPYSKHQLTNSEETIIRVCGIVQSVEGVSGVSLGLPENEGGESAEEMPSTSSKSPQSPLLISNTPKRIKINSTGERLNKFLDEDNKRKVELNEKLDELLKIQKENASRLRRVYRAIDKGHESITNAVAELKNEFVRVSRGILQSMQENNELKKKQLELDIMKFEYQKNNE